GVIMMYLKKILPKVLLETFKGEGAGRSKKRTDKIHKAVGDDLRCLFPNSSGVTIYCDEKGVKETKLPYPKECNKTQTKNTDILVKNPSLNSTRAVLIKMPQK